MARKNNGDNNGGDQPAEGENMSDDNRPQDETRSNDALNTPGGEVPMEQPREGAMPNTLGDTATQNAGNASPVYGHEPYPAIRAGGAPQHILGDLPDAPPSPWPIAPKPVDAGLVSPSGIMSRPAHHEAAMSHLTMRLGEMRNFLSGFDHATVLNGYPEMQELVRSLKHDLGLPEHPPTWTESPYAVAPTGPGTGGVARSGSRFGGGPAVVSTTSAGSYAQGSHGPHGVQDNVA